MHYHTTPISRNVKTGPMPVMTSSRETCPDSCPLKQGGCYAMTGPLKLHWDQVTSGARGSDLDEALKPIRKLNRGAIWRYGQAGDLPGERDNIDREGILKIAKASKGKRAIIFTHKPPSLENLAIIREAAAEGLNINMSADSIDKADELADLELPVAVVLHSEYGRKKDESLSDYRRRVKRLANYTPKGRKIAVCPATYTDVSCTQCGVCADGDRKGVIVGFPAHGTKKKRVDEIAGHAGEREPDKRG
ncbi:hypothetical protein [Mesorhizobium sp. B1-1-6]|uniref:DUF7227 family protein n=2 Tax=unclassified Mesorhizobium TaxID=325217 RepID=UPI001126CD45|nr:hypothetical protein [Mesorhizobium sp. B1-1-6]TPN42408.1 hypothetical protein FJ979_02370 [Mesorhizobium sp. B1-1-6]